jgi:hypothetical protein
MLTTFWKSFRAMLIYTLALLIGFQPSAMAIGEARLMRIELALVQSEMTKRQITLQEFLDAYGGTLPPAVRVAAEQIVLVEPNFRLPKINVQKVKGTGGETNLQLNFTDKIAGSASFYLEDVQGQFQIKWGGETFSTRDWTNAASFMMKAAQAAKMDSKNLPFFVKDPNYSKQLRFYSKAEYAKLKAPQQQKHYKSYVELLAAMEKVQEAQLRTNEVLATKSKSKKTSSLLEFEMWWSLVVAKAQADGGALAPVTIGDPCIAAGRIAEWGKRPSDRKFSCGGAQQSEILCDNGQLKCDENLFGPGLCAPNSIAEVATLGCAKKSSKFQQFATLPTAEQASIRKILAGLYEGPCSETTLERVRAAEDQRYPGSKIYDDQRLACIGLRSAEERFVDQQAPLQPSPVPPKEEPPVVAATPPDVFAPGTVNPCPPAAPVAIPTPTTQEQRGETAGGRLPPILGGAIEPVRICPTREDEHRVVHDQRRPAQVPACQDLEKSGQGVRSSIAVNATWDCLDVLDATRLNENPNGYCTAGGQNGRTLPYYYCECPPGEKAIINYGSQGSGASVSCPSKQSGEAYSRGKKSGFSSKMGSWFKKNGKALLVILGGLFAFWLHDKALKKSREENFRINLPPTTTLPPPPPPPPTPRV